MGGMDLGLLGKESEMMLRCAVLVLVALLACPSLGEAPQKGLVWSNVDVQVYGRLRLLSAYDTSRVNTGNAFNYVDTGDRDNEFNITGNQSRIGFDFALPEAQAAGCEIKPTGKLEFDFLGGGGTENGGVPRVRHAYAQLDLPGPGLTILAGQTWDLISPLNPSMIDDNVLWRCGNVGFRRPQVRVTKKVKTGEKSNLTFAGALTRTIGDTVAGATETGEDAGYPTVQGRVAATFPFVGPKPATVGVSGHYGAEQYDKPDIRVDSWSCCLDASVPLTNTFTVKGECYAGSDMEGYLGGINQGVNNSYRGIRDKGAWVAGTYTPAGKWSFDAGVGYDDARNGDLDSANPRTNNLCVFGDILCQVTKRVKSGLQISYQETSYRTGESVDDIRAQFLMEFGI